MSSIICVRARLPILRRAFTNLQAWNSQADTQISRKYSNAFILRDSIHFREGDRVLLEYRSGKSSKRKLTNPLRKGQSTGVNDDQISHSDIIDQRPPLRIDPPSNDGTARHPVFVTHPDLDTFTAESPRRVMPIYASYGATIVNLLDIHVEPPKHSEASRVAPTFEIFEAGTGHGGLTLQLSRAIAAGNDRAPRIEDFSTSEDHLAALEAWTKKRSAIVHTIDIDPLNRKHAEKIIKNFRGGMYSPHISFNVGTAVDWLHEQITVRKRYQFLDIVILDMPDVHTNLAAAANALQDGGHLLIFVPQITQVAVCVQEIQNKKLPLKMKQVVELGEGISTGRLWDVRLATVRKLEQEAARKARAKASGRAGSPKEVEETSPQEEVEAEIETSTDYIPQITIPPMVCRPKVFEVTRGGGFVGLWTRVKVDSQPAVSYVGLPEISDLHTATANHAVGSEVEEPATPPDRQA